MQNGLEKATGRRMWFVPGFSVWGLPSFGEYEYIAYEKIGSTTTYYFGTVTIGDPEQEVLFEQLTDHRGNSLPASIPSPRVMPRLKSGESAFVVGCESATRFRIARDPSSQGPVPTDLLIVEMGD